MMNNINISDLTLEQKVVLRLAELGYITSAGDIQEALDEFQYAKYMIAPINDDGTTTTPVPDDPETPDIDESEIIPDIKDEIANASGLPKTDCECDGDHIIECEHEAASQKDIDSVFDD